jgi:hypothetical protein
MDHIYSTEFEVGDNHYNVVVKYIDAHVTCSTDIDDDLARLVLKVQVHHHTWVCRRPEKMCRFGYPRMPCDFTIIAKPLLVDMDAQESKDITKKHSTTLELVKHVLNNELPENLSIQGLCDIAGVNMNDYYDALKVSRKGVVIVLKRSVKDRYVNNYNARWLRAWQGNMDIQLCPDQFAVATYITDYYAKDETGTASVLAKCWKSSKNMPLRRRLNEFKNTFLSHRQMGASEAFYRILPSLKVKNSSISCIFLSSGYPQNRSRFYKQIAEKKDEVPNRETVSITGREGVYQAPDSVHDHYSGRPFGLQEMCLAEFAITYTRARRKHTDGMHDGMSKHTGQLLSFNNGEPLPRSIISRHGDKEIHMSLRSHRVVLRIHKFKDQSNQEEHLYSEMLMFMPWNDEILDLHANNT